MMTTSHDAVIVGLGAAGSAVAEVLARRGLRVLGLDRHRPPHALGSTHGETRMIREAYFEAPFYVPLVQRAFDAWEGLERRSGRHLLHRTGGLMIGIPDGTLVTGSRASARAHDLPYEELEATEIASRFPAFRPDAEMVGILEPRAGYLDPEACVETCLSLAEIDGAELRTGEPVIGWSASNGGVHLRTPDGEYSAARAVFCAGAWTQSLLRDLELPLTVEPAAQYWFSPTATDRDRLRLERCPVYIWEPDPEQIWYGFPLQPRGVKVGFHYGGEEVTDPDSVRREVEPAKAEEMRSMLVRYIPAAAGSLEEATVCLYTNTPDHHFLVDRHPDVPAVWIVSACSGHGFKFASALGAIVAAALLDEDPGFDLAPFRLGRFASAPAGSRPPGSGPGKSGPEKANRPGLRGSGRSRPP